MDALSQPDPATGQQRTSPVIFVPGASHAERGWDLLRRHLERAGFTDVGGLVDANTRGDIARRAERLGQQIEVLRVLTGAPKVHLVGHSLGGIVARYFVQMLGGDAAVATLVTVGAPHGGTTLRPAGLGPAGTQLRPGSRVIEDLAASSRPTSVRFVNYFADVDLFVQPRESAIVTDPRLKAVNILVSDHHQLSLVLPTNVCRSIAHQLAAAEGLPGFGAPVAALPGGVVRLNGTSELPTIPAAPQPAPVSAPSEAAVKRSKAMHPSAYPAGRRRRESRTGIPAVPRGGRGVDAG